ncbi:MAG: hypothetical protein ACXACR_08340 [Candidatus Hodarchaeales archaeon]|jgi:hypothetical protein
MLKPKNLLLITLTFALVFMTIGFISAAETSGSFNVDTGGGDIIIDPDGCDEDWSGSTWSQCINKQQTFICFDKNSCGTEDLRPALCGEVRECGEDDNTEQPPSNGGGGSGGGNGGGSNGGSGGGGSKVFLSNNSEIKDTVCIENWVCEEWSNSDQSCGTRICGDKNQCGTTLLKPATSKACPDLGFAWITAAVIGGITSFATTGGGIILIFIILIIVAGILIMINMYKNRTKR